jgi:S-layer protein (TIGR01567 family)
MKNRSKKYIVVGIGALIVLTMFAAMVPVASAAEDVAAPYESMAAVNTTSANNWFTFELNSHDNPSLLYFDLDDKVGEEYLNAYSGNGTDKDDLTIGEGNLTYTTALWADPDTPADLYIAWFGAKYFVVDNGFGDWIISEKLVDEDDDDDHLLRVGESLSLPEGFALTALEIDVDGGEAWISLTKDGEEIGNEVVEEGLHFEHKEDLGASDDTVIINFIVETVFAGMNTNLVKINDIDLISMDTIEVENNDEDLIDDYKVRTSEQSISIESIEDVSLSEDGVVDILGDRFSIRVNEDGDYAALVKVITEPGTYELMASVNTTSANTWFTFELSSSANPSLLYFDLDDKVGEEYLNVYSGCGADEDDLTIGEGNLTYRTALWADPDTPTDLYIAWLGEKYFVVDNGSGDWIISEKLVDEDEDDDHLLRVGESLSLPEGFALSALEIDVDGGEAWISLTKDGEEIDNEVVQEGNHFVYEEDLGASDKTVVINFTVETVFAGMNTNLVKINDIDLISMDTVEVENNDEDLIDDFKMRTSEGSITIESIEDISLIEDCVVDIFGDRFSIRVNEDGDHAAVIKTFIVLEVIDDILPAIVISTPIDGTTVTTSSINVTGTATDNEGVTSLTVNGNPVTLGADGSFTTTVSLTNGANTITVIATDAAGNSATETVTVTYFAGDAYLVFAITPNSRLAQVGTPVTIFMSVINAGTATATDVSISQASSLPATIDYQMWDGAALTGMPDTPMDIGAGETVNYVLTINTTAEFASSSMTFNVSSTNGATAPVNGVNILTMAASTTPYADVIMMSTSLDVSTAVNTPTAFAIATINVGVADATDVSLVVDIPSSITGLVYQVNETNPDGSIIGPAVGLTIPIGGTPTFAVFLTPTQVIDYDPANNRIVLKLVDGSGKVVGAQSVAVSA